MPVSASHDHEDLYCLIFRCFKPLCDLQALGREVYGIGCNRLQRLGYPRCRVVMAALYWTYAQYVEAPS